MAKKTAKNGGTFKKCPNCGKMGYRAIIRKRDGAPIMKCIYCGFEGERNG